MPDFVLIHGDQVDFVPALGKATVTGPTKTTLSGSGPATLNGKKICVDGDEKKVKIVACPYTSPPYTVPGTGTLKIAALAANQKAQRASTGSKPVLLKGGSFTSKLEVQAPAKMPPPASTPDPAPMYSGVGTFQTTNTKLQGS